MAFLQLWKIVMAWIQITLSGKPTSGPHMSFAVHSRGSIQGEGEKINKLDGPKLISLLGAVRPITDSGQAAIGFF
jgi:hypothetical protein